MDMEHIENCICIYDIQIGRFRHIMETHENNINRKYSLSKNTKLKLEFNLMAYNIISNNKNVSFNVLYACEHKKAR